jgi:hypothetical protein
MVSFSKSRHCQGGPTGETMKGRRPDHPQPAVDLNSSTRPPPPLHTSPGRGSSTANNGFTIPGSGSGGKFNPALFVATHPLLPPTMKARSSYGRSAAPGSGIVILDAGSPMDEDEDDDYNEKQWKVQRGNRRWIIRAMILTVLLSAAA